MGVYYIEMSLGKKINIMLVIVTAVILSVAFWIIVSIEATSIKRQVTNDSGAVVDIMRGDVERMYWQVFSQQERLQIVVDKLSGIEGVKYINVADVNGLYIAATNRALVGKKADENDLKFIEQISLSGNVLDIRNDKGSFYGLERRTPVRLSNNNDASGVIYVVEIEVTTETKSTTSILSAEKLLQAISASIEQATRSIVVTRNENTDVIQGFTDELMRFGFYHKIVVFDNKLNVVASTSGLNGDNKNVSEEDKQLREDVLTGKRQESSVERTYKVKNDTTVRIVPLRLTINGKTERIGILEAHILTSAYKNKINALKFRMIGIGVVITTLIVIVIAIILRKEVVNPIVRYSKIAQKVSDGDLNQTIEHTTNDEIGHFGDVFNSMVGNLRELDRMKSDFLSVAAHQLRTPLSGVKWVLKLLLDGDVGAMTDDQRGMLTRGYETNEKMIHLVNDLLNVSRIENGKYGYNLEKNDFLSLINTLVESLDLASKERQVEVRVVNRAGTIPPFFFDLEKMLIALQNVVDNAIKYTMPGGHVVIEVGYQGDYLQVKVTDTGVGIPKADIPKLFSKFFRAANVIHLQTDGSGLGLFIVKSIILRHGGQIWIDSVEGKGTIITVVIPMVRKLPEKKEGQNTVV